MARKPITIDAAKLVSSAGNKQSQRAAAQQLGVSESTLRRRMRAEGTTWQGKQQQFSGTPKPPTQEK